MDLILQDSLTTMGIYPDWVQNWTARFYHLFLISSSSGT